MSPLSTQANSAAAGRVGVMVVGIQGATASTLAATSPLATTQDLHDHLVTHAAPVPLVDPRELAFGGWDPLALPWDQVLERHGVLPASPEYLDALSRVHLYPAAALAGDHAVVNDETAATAPGQALLSRLRDDIADFRIRSGVEQVVVVHLAAPARMPPRSAWPDSADVLLDQLAVGQIPAAAVYYAAAAVLEGCAVVDYTASPTLEIPGLVALAERHGVPLAGRDGSTGQTLLKSVLAQVFVTRRLPVRGWYSANILGNHDGLMLQDARFCELKRIDKTALLEQILGYAVQSHLVDIRHYLPAGDDKEAWDAIDFATWGGAQGRMRIDWQASDSRLATPCVLDLIRLSAWCLQRGHRGVQAQLGMFFKYALGTDERRYLHLAQQLADWLEAEAEATVAPAVA